jgi:hypothetical protein
MTACTCFPDGGVPICPGADRCPLRQEVRFGIDMAPGQDMSAVVRRDFQEQISAGFGIPGAASQAQTTTSYAEASQSIVEQLLRVMSDLEEAIRQPAMPEVHTSAFAMWRGPRRVHRRQRWDRSGTYHARIQKKWNKRFGFVDVPAAFMVDASSFDLLPRGPRPMLIIHDELIP